MDYRNLYWFNLEIKLIFVVFTMLSKIKKKNNFVISPDYLKKGHPYVRSKDEVKNKLKVG